MTVDSRPGAVAFPRPLGRPRGECETRDEDVLAAVTPIDANDGEHMAYDEAASRASVTNSDDR